MNINNIVDRDGLSNLTIFNDAASRITPKPERQKEEQKMNTGTDAKLPTPTDPWGSPDYWNILEQPNPQAQPNRVPAQQAQQQAPQIVAAQATQGNPLALPKDPETLNRMIQQEAQKTMVNTLSTLANINQAKNQTLDAMRRKFSETPGYAPWTGVFENNFNKMVNQGYDLDTAKKMSIEHVREMAQLGVKPPERSTSSIPSSNYRGGNLKANELRPDEDGSSTTFFSDEEKAAAREDWINRRNVAADYVKSGGVNGMSYQEMYPGAFNRGRTDLVIVKK